ncbi:glutamine synthetase6 [Zea mays]|uniref:Glutamine synthetase6 n=1 Tax=Zea mays TaxID=4577 RepID=A0A1D6JTN3_MAIZE|nr:glutamine synthetase6 [Zea mays]
MASLTDLVNLDLSDCTDRIIAEYIWIGGTGIDLRSKARTVKGPITDPSQLPKWNYDGSSTGQAPGEDSEVILYPQAIFKDPFRKGNHILVMCDCYTPQGEPIPTNKRYSAAKVFSHPDVAAEVPWYGIEQEYTLLQKDGVANRGASIRVGRDTEREGKGYFEDRRPASNMDPYVVTGMIAETTILWNGN